MNTSTKPIISPTESVRIDKELQNIKEVIDKYDSYFYEKDQLGCLRSMREEINQIFDEIFRRNDTKH